MTRIVFFLLIAALFSACEDTEPEANPTPKIYFTGISRIDQNGSPTAFPDTTDWRSDGHWIEQESDLFATAQPLLCSSTDSAEIYAASPNPAKGQFIVGLFTGSNVTWRFRLVDEDFKLLDSIDWYNLNPWYNAITWNTDSFPRDTIRLYYQIEKQGCMLRGHGDILIED